MSLSLNRKRAGWAAMALDRYRQAVGDDDARTLILDRITDLGHLARMSKLDFVRIAAQALSVWAYERKTPESIVPNPQVCVIIAGRPPAYAWRQQKLAAPPESQKELSTPGPASGSLTTGKDRS